MKNGKYELVVPPADYPGKRYRGRYAYEHHVAFWRSTGRLPSKGCVVHHKNDRKRDNDPENLEEKTRSEHSADHGLKRGRKVVELRCAWCLEIFVRRWANPEYKKFYCCRSHMAKGQWADRKKLFTSGGTGNARLTVNQEYVGSSPTS